MYQPVPRLIAGGESGFSDEKAKIGVSALDRLKARISAWKQDQLDMASQLIRLLGAETPIRLEGNQIRLWTWRALPFFKIMLARREERLFCVDCAAAIDAYSPHFAFPCEFFDASAPTDFDPRFGSPLQKCLVQDSARKAVGLDMKNCGYDAPSPCQTHNLNWHAAKSFDGNTEF